MSSSDSAPTTSSTALGVGSGSHTSPVLLETAAQPATTAETRRRAMTPNRIAQPPTARRPAGRSNLNSLNPSKLPGRNGLPGGARYELMYDA